MQTKKPLHLALVYALPFVLVVTALFLFLLFWERRNLAEEQREGLTLTATALLRQIAVTRLWNADHGGVYAEITDGTMPNPYPETRSATSSLSGKRYTKLNPACMTRQLAEVARGYFGHRFSITSLKPLNPSNRPDPWEEAALRDFERGDDRRMSVVREDGKPVFRHMVPLSTEAACLACHAKQHYRAGDIRGGIRVAIPMEESERIYGQRARTYLLAAGAGLWFCIIVFILLVSYSLSRNVVSGMTREPELDRLRTAVELAGAAAHEIRQPLTALIASFDLLKQKPAGDPATAEQMDMMVAECRRIDAILSRMLNLTEYRTRSYVGGIRITDLGEDRREPAP